MLQIIRDKATGVIGYIMVGLIVIVFGLFGIQQYFGGGEVPPVATVNGVDISRIHFQNAVQQRQGQILNMFGGNVPQGMFDSSEFKEDVLQGLIRNQLVGQVAALNGYDISDLQLAEHIQKIPAFQKDGIFSADQYDRFIERSRNSKRSFEADLRNSLTLDQVSSAYQSSAFLTQTSLSRYATFENQERKISYTILKSDTYKDSVSISDDDAKSFFESHKDEYMTQEQVRLEYVLLDEATLTSSISIDDEESRAFYANNEEKYQSPESRNVSHILFKLPEGSSADQARLIEEKAAAALKRLNDGEDFSEVAKEVSEDDLTANKGGDLGELFPGDLGSTVDKIVFSLGVSDVSNLIKTSRGFQIIMIDAINAGGALEYATVKDRVNEEIKQQKIETIFNEKSGELVNLSFENSDSLEGIADGTGIEVQQTDWFDRAGGEGFSSDTSVVEEAFSDAVLNLRKNSEVIDLTNGGQAVIHLLDYKKPEAKSFEDVKESLLARMADERAVELTRTKGLDAVKRLENGTDFAQVAEDESVELRQIDRLNRNMEAVPEVIRVQAFKMSVINDKPIYSGLELQNGNFAIVRLDEILSESSKATVDTNAIAEILRNQYSQRELSGMYKAMEARAEIKIFRENMDAAEQSAY